MKRIIGLVTALALGFLGFLTPVSPAEATNYPSDGITLTTSNLAVWPDDCGSARYSVSGPFKNYTDWAVSITIYDPHGNEFDGNYFTQTDTSTAGSTFLCPVLDTSGRYRVRAEYETYDTDGTIIEQGGVTGYFTFTRRLKQAELD